MKKRIFSAILACTGLTTFAQWEIRGSDQICTNTVYQLYYNGTLNNQNIAWEYSTGLNPANQVNIFNQSNSSVSLSLVSAGTGCSPSQTICCYPPTVTLSARLTSTNQIVASRSYLLLSCSSFPITGQTSTIPFPNPLEPDSSKTVYIFFMNGPISQNGRNCYSSTNGYSVWVVSDNLKIEDTSWVYSNKIKITRIGQGQGYLDFYFGDGLAYRKTIGY